MMMMVVMFSNAIRALDVDFTDLRRVSSGDGWDECERQDGEGGEEVERGHVDSS